MKAKREPWDHHGQSRQARGYGAMHRRIRAELLRTVIFCQECTRNGRSRLGRIADHIQPLAKGVTGDRSNYQLLCTDCAEAKDRKDRGARPKQRIQVDGWPVEAMQ